MIGLSLLLPLLLLPQSPMTAAAQATRARISLEWGLLAEDGSLEPARLGLGKGGFTEPGGDHAQVVERGVLTTPGGARITVKEAGCHVRFPSGVRLLVDARCRVHRRDGRATLASFHGVTLALADGSTLRMLPGTDRGLDSVVYGVRGEHQRLWRDGRAVSEPVDEPRTTAEHYLVLGDGDCLYRAASLAPVLWFERILAGPDDPWPVERVLVLGDLLRKGAALLADKAPRRSVQFRHAGPQADLLASRTREQFPPEAPGALELGARLTEQITWQIAPELRVRVLSRGEAPFQQLVVALQLGENEQTLAEWASTGQAARLFQLRPAEESSPWRVRTVQGGHPLTEDARALGGWLPRTVPAELWDRILRRTAVSTAEAKAASAAK